MGAAAIRRRCVLNQSSNIPTKFGDDWSNIVGLLTKWQPPYITPSVTPLATTTVAGYKCINDLANYRSEVN